MLVCFISIKCYDFFQSSSLRYTNFKLKQFEQFEQFILFKIQKAIDPGGNINI